MTGKHQKGPYANKLLKQEEQEDRKQKIIDGMVDLPPLMSFENILTATNRSLDISESQLRKSLSKGPGRYIPRKKLGRKHYRDKGHVAEFIIALIDSLEDIGVYEPRTEDAA